MGAGFGSPPSDLEIAMKEKFTTRIIVRECRQTTSGRTRSGGTYVLYQVIATKLDGTPIDMNLRSFSDLPKNVPIEVDAELYRSQQYGDSYTLTQKGKDRRGLGKSVDELRERVEKLEAHVFGGQAQPPQQAASPPPVQPAPQPQPQPQQPPPPPPTAPDPVGGGLPSDDDIPF